MDIFKCQYLTHENEEIIGFCLNQNCQKATQYCYECLTQLHSDHLNECIRFAKLNQFINEFIKVQIQQCKEFKEISSKVQNCFEQIQKFMEQDIEKLEQMTKQLQNKDYLTFKSQINIIKKFQSKEKENSTKKTIIQLKNLLDTIKDIVADVTLTGDQISQGNQKDIKLLEINKESEHKKEQNIEESNRLKKEGVELYNQGKVKEAIDCFDKSLAINPQDDITWNWKGSALNNLNKYQEAIDCYDKSIAINPKNDNAWNNNFRFQKNFYVNIILILLLIIIIIIKQLMLILGIFQKEQNQSKESEVLISIINLDSQFKQVEEDYQYSLYYVSQISVQFYFFFGRKYQQLYFHYQWF
ncbi:unnamed protein product [Paramecium sonneborni]|uniref:Tetratricopeptide repeat protein n=1 Tax=Paramecium sonneborni TaxID=65129 RepID=A0A8S1RUB5_9CILI|nr:unnamed protein product [Paramecium sonneborni]